MITRRLLLGLAVAAVVGCGDAGFPAPTQNVEFEPGAIVLTVVDTAAGPGQTLRVEQQNRLTVDVGYNHCGRTVQRRVGEAWESLPPELRMCTAVLYRLGAGVAEVVEVDIPVNARPGTYRFVLTFAPLAGQAPSLAVPSPAFEVR